MHRRHAVPAVVSLVIIGTLIVGVAAIGTQPSEGSVTIQDVPEDDLWQGSSPTGEVESIPFEVSDATVTWDELGSPAEEVVFNVTVEHDSGGPELPMQSQRIDVDGTSGQATPDPVQGDVTNYGGAEHYGSSEDGETRNHTIVIFVMATLITEDGNEVRETGGYSVRVSVTNEANETTEMDDLSLSRSVEGEVVMADTE